MPIQDEEARGSRVPKGVPAPPLLAIGWAVIIAVLLIALTWATRHTGIGSWVRAPDAWTYDARTAYFSPRVPALRDDITVVTVDETSMAHTRSCRR